MNKVSFKFYQAFRSQELSEYYNSLISAHDKFVPVKFHPKIIKNTPKFRKQLKRDHAIDNVVREIKLLEAICKKFHLKVKEIDESMLNKTENLDKDNNNTKFIIKECYQRNYENEEMNSRDIYNNKLDKLKKTYETEMQNENAHFKTF